jgi:hypothetical protein
LAALGADERCIADQLAKNGLPCLGRLSQSRELAAINDFKNGNGLMESCNQNGADIRVIENVLRNASARFYKALDMIKNSTAAHRI